jgi:protoheme IX farnesyltransferase
MSTARQPFAFSRVRVVTLLRDYAQLTKLRVTSLIVMTAWCGYYFAAHKSGLASFSWGLFHSLFGIALVSSGTAALNEVMEHDVDQHMRRTSQRPIPAGRMSLLHGFIAGELLSVGGSLYLYFFCNPLTGVLAFLTSVVYLVAYTPLKRISPICTFVGAFPGAMPGVLGWTAARDRFDWGTLVLFGILFFWQFPHFFSIAWLYQEDYARGEIRMLPVVEGNGRSTAIRILIYTLLLIPVSLLPTFLGMAGRLYLVSALLLSLGLLYFGIRLTTLNAPLTHAVSKMRARQLLQATVLYLPILFVVMMSNSAPRWIP